MKRGSSATSQKSVQAAKKRLTKFLRKIDTIPVEVIQYEAENLYQDIMVEVPYDSGALERSVKVSVSKSKTKPGINASASAKSKNGYDYAGIQHENPDFHHPVPGTKYHYISDPFHRCVDRITEEFSRKLQIDD